jgi:PKD repeat protein
LTVTDNAGATGTATTEATITDNQPPVADLGGPYNGTVGTAVQFDATGSSDPDGAIAAYDWDFGDGNIGTGANPSHTYAAAGTFTVSLTVTDNAGATATVTTTATITDAPAAIRGDIDGDGDVDSDDLNLILSARNTPASGPDDPRDLDGDGMITALDARQLTLLCTRSRCATE